MDRECGNEKVAYGFSIKKKLDGFSRKLMPTQPTDHLLRLYMYFAHDLTIAFMLRSLEINIVKYVLIIY